MGSCVRACMLVCWCVGVLVCWCVGVLVCWCVGVRVCSVIEWGACAPRPCLAAAVAGFIYWRDRKHLENLQRNKRAHKDAKRVWALARAALPQNCAAFCARLVAGGYASRLRTRAGATGCRSGPARL